MSRGRKPLPDAVKKLRGTDEKRRMRGDGLITPKIKDADQIERYGINTLLKTERARQIFETKCNQLMALNMLTAADIDQIAIYSDALDKLWTCVDNLQTGLFKQVHNEYGDVVKFVSNPYLKLYKDLIVIVNRIGSDFGFSPVSRMKIRTPDEEASSPFEELLNATKKIRKKR